MADKVILTKYKYILFDDGYYYIYKRDDNGDYTIKLESEKFLDDSSAKIKVDALNKESEEDGDGSIIMEVNIGT